MKIVMLLAALIALPAPAFHCKFVEARVAEMASGLDAEKDLLHPSFTRATLRWLFGNTVTATQTEAHAAVMKLDHAIKNGDLERAKNIDIHVYWTSRVLTLQDLWFIVDLAHLKMEVAERRTSILARLIERHPERAQALTELREAEWRTFWSEAQAFGKHYALYEPQKKFLDLIRENPECQGRCKTNTVDLLNEIGYNDPRLKSLAAGMDVEFENKMKRLGLTLPDRDRFLFQKLLVAPPAAEAGPIEIFTIDSLAGHSLLSVAQTAALQDGVGRQISYSVRRLFQGNTLSGAIMLIADRTPVGPLIRKTPVYKYLMPRLREAELRGLFGYDVAVLHRNDLSLAEKLEQLREIGTRGEPGDIIEFIAKQAEYVGFWRELYKEVSKEENRELYPDLAPHFKKWEDKRMAGKIKYWSSNYKTSPLDTFVRLVVYGWISYEMVMLAL